MSRDAVKDAAKVEAAGAADASKTAATTDSTTPNTGADRIAAAFANGKALVTFVTGGDPTIRHSEDYILSMIAAGADVIEIGVPFSDPIAEGPVIQEANLRALKAGTNVTSLFALVERLRSRIPANKQVPILLMGYLNPLLHYGYDSFFRQCAHVGIDGVIIADLPYDEKDELSTLAAAHGVAVISLIAPSTAADTNRVTMIAREAHGFIYLVSSLGVTGERTEIRSNLGPIIEQIRKVSTVPIAVGFGVHTPEQARELTSATGGVNADGIIVGSALVRLIATSPSTAASDCAEYVRTLKAAMLDEAR